ncbi:MAG TPA: tetratricopeptide repeat protein [Pyrinomonadaceae bacterium]
MSNIAPTKTADVATREDGRSAASTNNSVSIRVSPNSYFTALFLATFFSAFLTYLEIDWAAFLLFGASWLFLPLLLWSDRIVFDGKRLTRVGFLPRLWAAVNNSRHRLKISDIEQVETLALRALKRGGNVFYRYRTSVQGKDLRFAFASGGEDYRRMIQSLFAAVSENVLDNRSIELRDYLKEPKETLMKAEFAQIPSVDVLESSVNEFQTGDKSARTKAKEREIGTGEIEKSDYLRRLANELRLSGYLLQALETFRRALVLNPRNAWLIFDFARCLYSFAGAERSEKMEKKALAALRLAEKRANGDGELLARLGESYFQYGDWRRAQKAFQKALDAAGESFRSVRGLAEIALREGKIAHVIHNFSTANRLAETSALQRWTQNESEYFTRLNTDEDYMDLEISRVNMLETLERSKKTSLKIAFLGFPAILFGLTVFDDLIANIGWAISSVALLIWVGLILSQNLLSSRVPLDFDEED